MTFCLFGPSDMAFRPLKDEGEFVSKKWLDADDIMRMLEPTSAVIKNLVGEVHANKLRWRTRESYESKYSRAVCASLVDEDTYDEHFGYDRQLRKMLLHFSPFLFEKIVMHR